MNADPLNITVTGLKALDDFAELPDAIRLNAVRAINRTTERARTASARAIRQQVNLSATYLGRPDRLGITKKATRADMEARITGRNRPTSLATFATGGRAGARRAGATVRVQPGLVTRLPKAFFVNLRTGNTDTKGNLGLAIRLPEGKRPDAAYKPTKLGRGVWLLYGPSVGQVADDVFVEIGPETAEFMEAEFLRLMNL